jgi:8-oxo-dGTP pyrophosphatase MutT (NUDIX family)
VRRLKHLSDSLEGTLLYDDLHKTLYTDASVYRILPTAVALPKTNQDIVTLVRFAENIKFLSFQELQVPHWQDKQWETVLLWMFQNISLRLSLSIP